MASGNPPWYETDENGKIMILEVPARLKFHPEVIRRGLEPSDPSKVGVVYRTSVLKPPLYYIKIIDTDTEEAPIFQRLSRLRDPRNHTIPGELTSPEAGHPLLITPAMSDLYALVGLDTSLSHILSAFLQLIEGIEFLHSLRIAHMDISPSNVLVAGEEICEQCPDAEPLRVYIIDFGSSRQLPLGPGSQHAITLPPSQYRPADDDAIFDPYSWDVHCAALTMKNVMKTYYGNDPPLIARLYVNWLQGNERGCRTVCRCRPTARSARQVLTGILWGVLVWKRLKSVLFSLITTPIQLLTHIPRVRSY